MATCSAHKTLKTGGELNCDLAPHAAVLKFHYDSLEDLEWRDNHVPVAVPYTPTGPIPKVAAEK